MQKLLSRIGFEKLLEHFDNGGSFGDDPDGVLSMRRFIQENRRLLYEMNNEWLDKQNFRNTATDAYTG